MKVNIVCVGRIGESFYTAAANEYAKRLSRFCDLKVTECAEVTRKGKVNPGDAARILKEESLQILKNLRGDVIAMDIGGEQISSPELARLVKDCRDGCGEMTFVVGGSYGLSDEVKCACRRRVSFGRVTYPHQLMRVILLEQVYRSFMILSGSEYHK